MQPMLSIIIPTYNRESCLDECLGSVLDQLPCDCELIVVDDGSTDGTVKRLAGYDGKYDNLHILYHRHKGASGARNAGIRSAKGEYITFVDCDDCLRDGFLDESRRLLKTNADLYIFGIEQVQVDGKTDLWTVKDRLYNDISAFADDYIRKRNLMIYSNCNKFYRRRIIEELDLCFDEGVEFGEDRLFNYRYLTGCGRIETSSLIMLRYMRRYEKSMSTKYVPHFFERVMMLHRAKTECFLALSKGTSQEERRDFAACDLCREIGNTIARFGTDHREKEDNLPAVNELVFGAQAPENEAWYEDTALRKEALEGLKKRIIDTTEV